MNLEKFLKLTLKKCKQAKACDHGIGALKYAIEGDRRQLLQVLRIYHGWAVGKGIYTAKDFLEIEDQESLLEMGLKTQLNCPIDFKPEKVGDVTWKPYNAGATDGDWRGVYLTFDQANCEDSMKKYGKVPSANNFRELCHLSSEWSIYQNQFGRLFDDRIFIPAGGVILHGSAPEYVGNHGYSWSSPVSGTSGVFLDFSTTWLNPSNAGNRAHGLQVRCLQE